MVGRAQRPQHESFRLGQQASMVFAPREIAEVTSRGGMPVIKLYGLGMLGPNGPLPIHMTETVRERAEGKRDATLANFLDIFHHRYLSHLYRAWAQAQSTAGLDRRDAETFSPYVARIAGDEPADTAHDPLPQHARWASSAHRVREARNPDGLVNTLANYYGVGVELHEYQLHWIAVEPVDICHMGVPRMSSMLGQGAVAGSNVPDRQHKFRLVLGPLRLHQYLRFTPQGADDGTDLHSLVEWVRAFVGYEYVWEVELVILREEAPPARLGGEERLGWSSWMGSAMNSDTVTGMVYEPENYLQEQAALHTT
jgi:type VI secretion system protein ImpH